MVGPGTPDSLSLAMGGVVALAAQLRDVPIAVAARVVAALAYSSISTDAAGEFARRASASMPLAGRGREK